MLVKNFNDIFNIKLKKKNYVALNIKPDVVNYAIPSLEANYFGD